MKNKILFMLAFMGIYIVFMPTLFVIAEEDRSVEQQKYSNDIESLKRKVWELKNNISNQYDQNQQNQKLQKEVENFRDGFYNKTMQNVNLALQGANRATNLVSVFAVIFTVLTVVLGLWGKRELAAIRKVKEDAERDLKLTKHLSRASTYTQLWVYPEAIKEFLKVVEIDNNNNFAHTQLGFLFLSSLPSDFSKSKFHSNRAIKLNPRNYTAYLNLGVAMNAAQDEQREVLRVYLQGEKIAKEALADDITIGKFNLFAGHCHKNLEENTLAKTKYDKAKSYFEKHKYNHQLPLIAMEAKRWLDELEDSYKIVTKDNSLSHDKPS